MTIGKKHKITLLTLAAAGGLLLTAVPRGHASSATPLPDDPVQLAALQDSLMNVGNTQFRAAYQTRQADEEGAQFYPQAYSASQTLLQALNALTPGSQQWYACKEMLQTLNKDLEAGAFYYSGKGDTQKMNEFARAFIDLHIDKAFEGDHLYCNTDVYPALVYNAASDAYNNKEYDRAIEYFKAYFATGEPSRREVVYTFMGQAAINTGQYDLALTTLGDAVKLYPQNSHLRNLSLDAAIKGGKGEYIQPILSVGLEQEPNNTQYLQLQGMICEDNNEFRRALDYFQQLDRLEPNKLSTSKHIALCYYNEAVNLFNQASTVAKDEKEASKLRTKARNYFAGAAQKLEEVLASDPLAVKYLRCLGVSYLCMEKKDLFEGVNNKLKSLGEDPLANMYMPPLASYEEGRKKNFNYGSGAHATIDVPPYSEFAMDYVSREYAKWFAKGWNEKNADYEKRVTAASVQAKQRELNKEAQDEYIKQFTPMLRLNEMTISDYDADHEVFKIDTEYGSIYPKVPNKDGEAEFFRNSWQDMRFLNTKFAIYDNSLRVSAMTILTPMGKSYEYSDRDLLEYEPPIYAVNGSTIAGADQGQKGRHDGNAQGGLSKYVPKSDVDENIPENRRTDTPTYALIIANEDYKYVPEVQFAQHDGFRFREYCVKTMGIPEENIQYYPDITLGDLKRAVSKLTRIVNAAQEAPQVVVYYAGHGLPDNTTKDAYLMPVDSDPLDIRETGYSLKEFYSKLGNMGADNVTVFIDACFSGAQRDGAMMLKERGVVIDAEEAEPQGNMFVLSACSGKETAQPLPEKSHGMFTYYLLKKMQESGGKATLQELSDYVISNVKSKSSATKLQTPTVTLSGRMHDDWKKLRVKK